jgi:hypothetical protein
VTRVVRENAHYLATILKIALNVVRENAHYLATILKIALNLATKGIFQ